MQIKTNIPHSNDMNQSDKIYHIIIKKKLESNKILLFISVNDVMKFKFNNNADQFRPSEI